MVKDDDIKVGDKLKVIRPQVQYKLHKGDIVEVEKIWPEEKYKYVSLKGYSIKFFTNRFEKIAFLPTRSELISKCQKNGVSAFIDDLINDGIITVREPNAWETFSTYLSSTEGYDLEGEGGLIDDIKQWLDNLGIQLVFKDKK